ncbi:MAG: O-antigen ligase family protein, partial [Chloroflexota bacterium]
MAGVAVPLAFHTLGALGFESTKVLLVRMLALVLVVGWLGTEALRIGSRPGPFAWRSMFRHAWEGPLRLTLIGVVGIALSTALATATSLKPLVSLMGSWERQLGLVTVLAWLVLGVSAAIACRDASRRYNLLRVWTLGSVPACLYAFVQAANLDPINWLHQPLGVASTLGSSTALATYLGMLVPLTLVLAVEAARQLLAPPQRSRREARWYTDPRVQLVGFAALAAAQVAALLMTQVRGGILALVGGLLVMVAVFSWPTHRRLVLVGGSAAFALLLLASALLAAVPRPDMGDGQDTSARQRVLIWQDALTTIAGPRILIGYGPETQMVSLEPHYPVELAARFEDQRFDRAHNLLLDTTLTTGLLGLVALVAAVVGIVLAGLHGDATERGVTRWLPAGLLGALAANLVAGQFAFDTAATGALFWMLAGVTVAPLVPRPVPPASPVVRPPSRRKRAERQGAGLAPAVRLRATAMLAAGAVGLATIPWLTGPFLADLYHTRALALRAGEAPGSSAQQELQAARSVPWLDVPLLELGEIYFEIARTTTLTSDVTIESYADLFEKVPSSRAAVFDAARVTLERAAAMNPLDPYPHA